jgi:translation initiation factor 4E
MSPTSGSSAFGLGSGAFASFGSAKTPKTPGNPFETAMKSAAAAEKQDVKAKQAVQAAKSSTGSGFVEALPAAPGDPRFMKRYPLARTWVWWFRPPIPRTTRPVNYEETIHATCFMDSVESFWAVYRHHKRPSALPIVSEYSFFKKDIRPIWEDKENKEGGKWLLRLKKGVADRYWEWIIMALIGEQFGEANEDVCGAVLSIRAGEDQLSIWVRNNTQRSLKIRYVCPTGATLLDRDWSGYIARLGSRGWSMSDGMS